MGRILCDCDNIMIFIEEETEELAKIVFLEKIKKAHDWNGKDDIYIEFCIPISQHIKGEIYNDICTQDSFFF
ncbi:hypothetical protein, partial [Photobacterium leiognathi]|uniref:hypothetical protein n=1 Tax=Photobacterium leiognathi TaxID=553611 RepID=UPI002739DF46